MIQQSSTNDRFCNMWSGIIEKLPKEPDKNTFELDSGLIDAAYCKLNRANDISDVNDGFIESLAKAGFWTNGDFILCPTEDEQDVMLAFLETMILELQEDYSLLSGYYDSDEDQRNNEVDDCTGFYYVDIE